MREVFRLQVRDGRIVMSNILGEEKAVTGRLAPHWRGGMTNAVHYLSLAEIHDVEMTVPCDLVEGKLTAADRFWIGASTATIGG